MLTLRSIKESQTCSIEMNEYVPLQIEFEPRVLSLDEVFYWRSTNEHYLLEVKISSNDGAVAEVSLVLVPTDRVLQVTSIRDMCAIGPGESGLPCFLLSPWKEKIGGKEIGIEPALRRYDEGRPFRLIKAKDGVGILFDGMEHDHSIENGKVRFLFSSKDELSGICVCA